MKKILVPALLALLLFTAGCEKPPENNPPATPDKPAQISKPEVAPDKKPEQTSESAPPETIDKPKPPIEGKTPPTVKEPPKESINIKVYYPDDSGMKLVEVEREIFIDDSKDKYTAAVETLLEEPPEENLTKIFPKNAAIKSVKVEKDLAIVDFDGAFLKTFVGGSTGEEFLVGSVVDTLTNFPEVKRVKFLVDGQEIETLSGHMDLSMPLERMSDLTN
ncbi:MAG: GerMN domain-containing protein [Selenomonadaceae bacterium]|nr:GerMN domain-containing protein [Selenomonadaceae bacterium]